jgi:hypothetical protein
MEEPKEAIVGIATINERMPATIQRTNLATAKYAFFIFSPHQELELRAWFITRVMQQQAQLR